MRGDVLAQPAAGLVQAGLGGAGSGGDLPGGLVGVVEQGDGVALPGGQAGDRAAEHVGAVQVLSRRQGAGGGRVQVLGPVAEQGQRRAAPLGAADVGHDAAQPAGEPVGVAQPVQRDERLQEGVLHGVVGVVGLRAQPGRAGAGHRQVPFDQQPERGRVAVAGQPDQVAVTDVHARLYSRVPGGAGDSSAPRSSTRPRPAREMPNRMTMAVAGDGHRDLMPGPVAAARGGQAAAVVEQGPGSRLVPASARSRPGAARPGRPCRWRAAARGR